MHYGRCASDESSYLDRTSLVNKVFILSPNCRGFDSQRFVLLLFSILRVGRPPRHWFISFSRLPFPASFASTLNVPLVFLVFVFKAIHGFAPTYLRELVSIKRSGNYNLRSSSDGLLLATPTYRSRVTLGDRSFQVAAPALWNVCSITDLEIFKCHLKTHLFTEAFY